jgi:hypothetical protein
VSVRASAGATGDALGPFRAAVTFLLTMPGLSETTARALIAEIGTDVSRFPSVGHLMSWAGWSSLTKAPAKGARRGLGRHPLARTNTDQRSVGRRSQERLLPAPNSGGSIDAAARRSPWSEAWSAPASCRMHSERLDCRTRGTTDAIATDAATSLSADPAALLTQVV